LRKENRRREKKEDKKKIREELEKALMISKASKFLMKPVPGQKDGREMKDFISGRKRKGLREKRFRRRIKEDSFSEEDLEVDRKFYDQFVKNENEFLNFQVKLEKLYERARKKEEQGRRRKE